MNRWLLTFVAVLWTAGALGLPCVAEAQLNMNFLSSVPGGLRGIWGYTDGAGREYALCCTGSGLKIVNITNPLVPTVVTTVPAVGSDLKEVKTYLTYAYCINQVGALQIIDLQFLPDSAKTVATFNSPTYNGGHTIYIEHQHAFVCKNGTAPTDLRILSLSNPTAPVEVGHFTHPDAGFVFADAHDCFVRDTFCYVANLAAGFVVLSIADMTSPRLLAKVTYPGAFTHNMWADTTGNYLFTTDEVADGHIRAWDLTNLAAIQQVAEYRSGPNRIAHNCFTLGEYLHIAYYGDGVRVVDVSNPLLPTEVGAYDTYPQGEGAFFDGCWGVYPYFPSGIIVASDMTNGLFVLSFNGAKAGYASGTARDQSLNPLGDVLVTVVETGRSVTTDLSGAYAFGALPGSYTLVFSKFGYRPDTLSGVAVTSGTTSGGHDAQLLLLAGAGVGGTVTRAGCASAVAGAAGSATPAPVPDQTTGPSGDFNFGFLPQGTYQLAAARFGLLPAETTVTVTAGPAITVSFALLPGVDDNAELNQGWLLGIPGDDATTGIWERVDPNGTVGAGFVQPEDDHTPDGTMCFVTGQSPPGASIGANDVDGGTTTLQSPLFSLRSFIKPTLEYWRWYTNNQGANPNSDSWVVRISDNGGLSWVVLENTQASANFWQLRSFALTGLVSFTDRMLIQFIASDLGGGSVVEAAVDDIRIVERGVYGDFNDDLVVTASDIISNVNFVFKSGPAPNPLARSDANGTCFVNAADIVYLVNFVFKGGPPPVLPCPCDL